MFAYKRIIPALLVLLFFTASSFAQVDWVSIKDEVRNPSSSHYYPSLLKRFQQSDTTLKFDDFKYLYYGFAFEEEYARELGIDSMEVEAKERNKAANYIGAYELCDTILNICPVSIGAFWEKSFACYSLKRIEEEEYNRKRYKVIIKTILANGTGENISKAYPVLSYNDMYEVTDYLDFNITKEERVEENGLRYYVLYPEKNKLKVSRIYFFIPNKK